MTITVVLYRRGQYRRHPLYGIIAAWIDDGDVRGHPSSFLEVREDLDMLAHRRITKVSTARRAVEQILAQSHPGARINFELHFPPRGPHPLANGYYNRKKWEANV